MNRDVEVNNNKAQQLTKGQQHHVKNIALIRHVTMVGFWINFVLIILKLFFGYWGHSDALVADGYHSVSDFVTDFIVLFCVGIAYKKADTNHPYGHGKYETIASVLIGVILFAVAVFIGYEGVITIIGSYHGVLIPKPDVWTIFVALISIVAKEYCYRYTIKVGTKLNSSSVIANAWHHRSDAFSSIATLIGVSLSFFLGENWRILDPIASVVIALFIAGSAISIIRPSLRELLEVSVSPELVERLQKTVYGVEGVSCMHNLRARRNGHLYVVDMNVHVDPNLSIAEAHHISDEIEKRIKKMLGGHSIIYVHVEPESKHNAQCEL